jgi:1-acyl-sn-glycerol-3-phosphate acyltransferase
MDVSGMAAIWLWLSPAAVLVAFVGWLLFRRPLSPLQWILYYYNRFLVHVLWRAELPEKLPIPPGQGAVVICNHRSSIDPCFIQAVAGTRVIHWMVAQIYSESTLLGRMLKIAETIPVRREGRDVSPLKAAIRLAAAGELIGMLPEGRINPPSSGKFMRKVRPGAVLVALKARVPILPCYVEGSPYHEKVWKPLFMRARAKLVIGEPIDLSAHYGQEREEGVVARLTAQCVKEIARLAGHDDFEPELADRDWMAID